MPETPFVPAPSTLAAWLRTLPPPPDVTAVVSPRTAAQDSVLRLACVLWAITRPPVLPEAARARLLARLQDVDPAIPLSPAERHAIQGPLLAWLHAAQPGSVEIVARQFETHVSCI